MRRALTLLLAAWALSLGACAAKQPSGGMAMSYDEALARTDPALIAHLVPGSAEEEAAIAAFREFLCSLTPEGVKEKTRQVYAEDAYLNDTLKEVIGVAAIEAYFLHTAEAADRIAVQVHDVAASGGNYYYRWTMEILHPRLAGGQPTQSIGMSHVRFDARGKVVLHQDYWDSGSAFYAQLPVLGRLIGWVKGRL